MVTVSPEELTTKQQINVAAIHSTHLIDHDTLFVILEKYVGITGSALQLLKSYFFRPITASGY